MAQSADAFFDVSPSWLVGWFKRYILDILLGPRAGALTLLQGWLVGCGLSTISAVDQVLTGTLTLFQVARVRERRCHVQRPGIEPGWLNLEARNLPLDQNAPHEVR